MEVEQEKSITKGLLLSPRTAGVACLINKHRRAGSTGTTGDESGTTDDEDNVETEDEPDCSLKEHVTSSLYKQNSFSDKGSFSDIATIADKTGHLSIMFRNSSDSSSVYSDLGLDSKGVEDLSDFDGLQFAQGDDTKHKTDWGRSLIEVKEQAVAKLQKELRDAHQVLKLRDEEVTRLTRIRQDVETELEELTASLFQEAHNMVREANEKQAGAEKSLKESQMKVDVLTAEVSALKTLVLTSTPSRPNPHLHPQIDLKDVSSGVVLFNKKHRRSPSHYNLKYGRENSPPESPINEPSPRINSIDILPKEGLEVDPEVHQEFLTWKENPTLEKHHPFIQRIYLEDIELCLSFTNTELSEKVKDAVHHETILIESISDKTKAMFPKKCALLEVSRLCFYRMNVNEPDVWYSISQLCRNRIIAVCEFLNYLKYIERGLVKSSVHEIYREIIRLRKNMTLARLGINIDA